MLRDGHGQAEAAQSVNLTGWVIDEAGDLPGTGPVALCGADLDPGSVQRNPGRMHGAAR